MEIEGTYVAVRSGKRCGLNVRFAPKATDLLRRRELQRCAEPGSRRGATSRFEWVERPSLFV